MDNNKTKNQAIYEQIRQLLKQVNVIDEMDSFVFVGSTLDGIGVHSIVACGGSEAGFCAALCSIGKNDVNIENAIKSATSILIEMENPFAGQLITPLIEATKKDNPCDCAICVNKRKAAVKTDPNVN